jgi:hypothetical protein
MKIIIIWLIVVSCFWGYKYQKPPAMHSKNIQINQIRILRNSIIPHIIINIHADNDVDGRKHDLSGRDASK